MQLVPILLSIAWPPPALPTLHYQSAVRVWQELAGGSVCTDIASPVYKAAPAIKQ